MSFLDTVPDRHRDHLPCVNYPHLMYPDPGITDRHAKQVCAGCPVTAACLQWALTHEEGNWGVWGGLSAEERHDMKAGRSREPIDPALLVGVFRCGHPRTRANVIRSGVSKTGLRTVKCRTCSRERRAA